MPLVSARNTSALLEAASTWIDRILKVIPVACITPRRDCIRSNIQVWQKLKISGTLIILVFNDKSIVKFYESSIMKPRYV
jgi:hypothetical protein